MKPRHPITAFLLFGSLLLLSLPAPAVEVRGETVTAAETAILPPVCKLILVEKPNMHIGAIAQKKNAELFDRPEYRMAKNAIHLHHWCRAIVVRQRYFKASVPMRKRGYKAGYHDEMDYVIRNMGPAWPYMPLMHAEKGEMYLLDKKYGEAVSHALTAIRLNPEFARGHVLLVNVYNAMGQKPKALEAATEGLRYNPNSWALKKMYDELGGPKPYPEPVAKQTKPQPAPVQETAKVPEPEPEPPAELPPPSSGEFKSADEEAAVPQPLSQPGDPASANSTMPGSAPGQKKYCRFCP